MAEEKQYKSFNRQAIVEFMQFLVQERELDANDLVVSGSGALVMMGFQDEAQDLDISIHGDSWTCLATEKDIEVDYKHKSGKPVIHIEWQGRLADIHLDALFFHHKRIRFDGVWLPPIYDLIKERAGIIAKRMPGAPKDCLAMLRLLSSVYGRETLVELMKEVKNGVLPSSVD